MLRHSRILLAPLILGGLAFLAPAAAEPLQFAPQEGVLLLKNGQVLSGKITSAGDRYYVALSSGEIRLRASDVACCRRTLDECYHYQRERLRPGEIDEHLQLAEWCLNNGLPGHAAKELIGAMAADPTHPRIEFLDRRLRLLTSEPEPTTPSSPQRTMTVTNEDLDRLARDLPAGVLEFFTTTVQPLLVNHCANSGCHGPTSTSTYRLARIPLSRTPSRRVTLRNLHATIALVNRQDPAASPLLTVPIQPHGPAKTAVFNDHKLGQFRQLVAWTHRVAQQWETPPAPATVEPASQSLLQTMHAPGVAPPATSAPATIDDEKAAAPTGEFQFGPGDAPASEPPTLKRGADPIGYTPRDPFDAELFNRRFFPSVKAE